MYREPKSPRARVVPGGDSIEVYARRVLSAFQDDYRWSAAFALCLGSAPYGGAEFGEVERVRQRLLPRVGDDEAWFDAWTGAAEQVRERAVSCAKRNHAISASASYLRAASYFQIGERFRLPKDDRAHAVYRSSVDCFHRFAELTERPRIEPVEVPYEGAHLPAYFVQAEPVAASAPCLVFFDGLDITKELQYLRGVGDLVRRGIACLVVDGPGNGESIRFRGLTLRYDYERAGSAALDYLAARHEVDSSRVAVMGISLGGYYAARCAAREPRFAACVCWGAIWDYQTTWQRRYAAAMSTALSVPGEHIAWACGTETVEEALETLASFSLKDVVGDLRCPLLVTHGARDRQIPIEDARLLVAAAGSRDKSLRVFDEAEGGAEHCQVDSPVLGAEVVFDWLEERLLP
jgi:pimeloyl-ACP methyl ester carboxylesterase